LKDGTFLWKSSRGEFRSETNGLEGSRVVVSGHGRPAYTRGGQSYSLPRYMAGSRVAFHLPGALLLEHLQNELATIEFIHDPDSPNSSGIRVRTSLISDPNGLGRPPLEWTFDPATGLPTRLEYWMVASAMPYKKTRATIEMANYREFSGVLLPSLFTTYVNGAAEGTFRVSTARPNLGIAKEEFDLLPREVQK
jgi:hypothetical protein